VLVSKKSAASVTPDQVISSGGKTMIKAGDMLKNIENGKVFTVKSTSSSIILLATKDESHSMFVSPDRIESTFVPFVEDEPKKHLKS
jgi:hypothetical protein